jgi:hypothetical protein
MVVPSNKVLEHSTHNFNINVLNPATGTVTVKMAKVFKGKDETSGLYYKYIMTITLR